MTTDNLNIFGVTYTGVAGVKATDTNGNTLVYIRPEGTLSVTSNGTQDVTNYASVNVQVAGETPTYQTKTVTPTESQQTVSPDTGYDALSSVTVDAISSTYVGSEIEQRDETDLTASGATVTVPAGYYAQREIKSIATGALDYPTLSIDKTTGKITSVAKVQTSGYLDTGARKAYSYPMSVQEQATITPTESSQIAVEAYKYTLGNVSVAAIPSNYIGSDITQRDETDLTASGATVTVPAGYYSSQASKAVSSGSATGPSSLTASSATVSTGTDTITLTKTGVTTTPTVSAGYVSSATPSTATVALTASVTTKAATTYTPGTTDQTISSGTYLTGTQTISGDSDLVAENIKKDVTIFGITGTAETEPTLVAKTVTPTTETRIVTPTSTSTVLVSDSLNNYYYLNAKTTSDSSEYKCRDFVIPNEMVETFSTFPNTYHLYLSLAKRTCPYAYVEYGKVIIDADLTFTSRSDVITIPINDSDNWMTNVVVSITSSTILHMVFNFNSNVVSSLDKPRIYIVNPDATFNSQYGWYASSTATADEYDKAKYLYNYATQTYYGLSQVTVNGDADLVAGNVKQGVTIFGVEGTYTGAGSTIDSLSVTPSESEQTFNSSSVDGYKPVVVGAISSTYVGSGIAQRDETDLSGKLTSSTYDVIAPAGYYPSSSTYSITRRFGSDITESVDNNGYRIISYNSGYYNSGSKQLDKVKTSSDLTVSGATVTAPAGYYASSASASVTNGSATNSGSASASSATITTGTNTITLSKAVSITPTVSAGYISSGTAGSVTVSLTGSAAIDPTPTSSGKTVTIPAGYYTESTTKDVSTGSATGPSSLSGTSATVSTGTNTLTLTKTGVTTTPTVSAGYISGATASTATVTLTASVTTKAAATITPGTSNKTIAAGTYLTGTQTIAGDADLVAGNIKSGVQIFGVTGNLSFITYYTGTSDPSSSLGSNGDIYLKVQ